MTAATIRGVAVGVVGVAVIQSLLIRAGFFAIGLSSAGVLTLVVLLFAIVQVPAVLVTLPVIAYVLATEATTPAIIFSIWTVIAGLSDNLLKPLMLGRGLEVPMPVILIGVIGGMVADGLLGLFVGPVLPCAVGYVLLMEWLRHGPLGAGRRLTIRSPDRGYYTRPAGDVGMPCTSGAGVGIRRALLIPILKSNRSARNHALRGIFLPNCRYSDGGVHDRQHRPGCVLGIALQTARCI